jgi:hypothetical protein
MQEYLILYFVDCTRIAKKPLNYTIWRSRAGRSKKTRLRLKIFIGKNQTSKPHGRPTRTVYRTTLKKRCLQQTMVFVMNVPRWRRQIMCACNVCVHCSACVHPLPDCCRFYGDQLSCIDCYRRRHVIFVPHAICDGDSSQLLAKKDTASKDVKTLPESNKKARLGEGWKSEDKNDEVAKRTTLPRISRRLMSQTAAPKRKMI